MFKFSTAGIAGHVDHGKTPLVRCPTGIDTDRLRIEKGTSVINTRVILLENEELLPNDRGLAQFRLMKPIAALPGDPFVICLLNIQTVIASKGVLTVGDCKEVLGYGRTVGVPVFEYLDAIGFTIRQGDKRVLKTDH